MEHILKYRIDSTLQDMNFYDENKWLKIAFPVAIFSIFCSLTVPNVIFLVAQYLGCIPDSFMRIALGTVPVQLSLLLPILIAAFLHGRKFSISDVKRKLKLISWSNKYIIEALKVELIIFIPLCVLTFAIHFLIIYFGYDPSSPITNLLAVADLKGVLLIFFASVFIAPIAEEIIFRRIFFSFSIKVMSRNSAVIITSFLFATLHGGLVQIIPLTLFGCVLQVLYIKHKSLYPCLILHSLHNFIMMSLFLVSWILIK